VCLSVCARSQPRDTGGIRNGRDQDSETEPSPKEAAGASSAQDVSAKQVIAKEETASAPVPKTAAAAPAQVPGAPPSKTLMGGNCGLGGRMKARRVGKALRVGAGATARPRCRVLERVFVCRRVLERVFVCRRVVMHAYMYICAHAQGRRLQICWQLPRKTSARCSKPLVCFGVCVRACIYIYIYIYIHIYIIHI